MPKVSVIIPVYNTENYLSKCLDSVVNQTLKDIEIICINDGSTDNSLQILKEYAQKDNRIIIINQENQGVSAARNVGIKNVNSDYVTFLDSDDYLEPETCELALAKIQNTNAGICCFGMNIIQNGNIIKRMYEIEFLEKFENSEPDISAKKAFLVNACGKLFKASFISNNHITFPINIKSGEDAIFNIECLYCNPKYCMINKHFYNYIKDRPESTTNNLKNTVKNDIEGFKYFFNSERFKNITDDFKIIALEKFISQVSYYYNNVTKYRWRYLFQISMFKKYLYKHFSKELLSNVPNIELLNKITVAKTIITEIFSIKNSVDKKHKVVTILGIKIKFKRKNYE